ncbi:MAG: tRNA (N6-threonylcarbamoyladenosine(37)-N6)-methyltransferase TrmO [Gammaproteobacteria bacterium]|nr:tRNA (N6-threonylcarbamoyladenosine(37)-N6)-methyltransferase TrmO [Gammaproteobacteria bacterium]
MSEKQIQLEPVAVMRSPFDEKFGIPRQSGLSDHATGEVVFLPPYDDPAMLDQLDGFSHVWLTFRFNANVEAGWRPRVRPPRLGGNREVGVWASRSPFRPNALGLSVVRLCEVVTAPRPLLRVAGVDLLDGTPILDVKPYLPYSDAIPGAQAGYATDAPQPMLPVRFATQPAEWFTAHGDEKLRALVVDVLALDPRPAYRDAVEPERRYGMRLAGHEIRWRVDGDGVEVVSVCLATDAVEVNAKG